MDVLTIEDPFNVMNDMFLVAIFLIIPVALMFGYFVRIKTNFNWPTDFFSLSILAVIVGVLYARVTYALDVPLLWIGLFVLFYLLGHQMGKNVTEKDRLELMYVGQTQQGNIVFRPDPGVYIKHAEYGLCRLADDNKSLFNQVFRGIYHKVETNAPLDANALFREFSENDIKEFKPPYANIEDEDIDLNIILIESIETTRERDITRFLHPTVPKTVVRLARGSAVPKAKLLTEFGMVDTLNKAIAEVEAELLKVRTDLIPALPHISAEQLTDMAENNPLMSTIRKFMERQGDDGK